MKNADMPAMPVTDECGMPFNDIPAELSTIGLTKREMFAMHAMQSIISNPAYFKELQDEAFTSDREPPLEQEVACLAIEYADALLKELEK